MTTTITTTTTTTTTTAFTMSHSIEQAHLAGLEAEFEDFRNRIAKLSLGASGVLTGMYNPLGPVDLDIIDIDAVEAIAAPLAGSHAPMLELVAATDSDDADEVIDLAFVEVEQVHLEWSPSMLELLSA